MADTKLRRLLTVNMVLQSLAQGRSDTYGHGEGALPVTITLQASMALHQHCFSALTGQCRANHQVPARAWKVLICMQPYITRPQLKRIVP